MAVSRISTNGPIVFNGSSDVNLDGIENMSIDPGMAQFIESAGGQVNPSYIAVSEQDAQITASITDLSTALSIITLEGLGVKAGATYTDLKAYFTEAADLGARADGTANFLTTVNKAFVVPTKLSARQGEKATLDIEIHALYDGTNIPYVFTDNVALPHTPSIDELFTVGKATINGTDLDGITGIDIDFGITVEKVKSDGDPFATYAYISQQSPVITLTTLEAVSLNTFGFSGVAQGGTASTIYFRKVDENATRVADNVAEHIKVTVNINQGMIHVGSTGGGSAGAKNESTVIITPSVGAAAIMTISNASTIT